MPLEITDHDRGRCLPNVLDVVVPRTPPPVWSSRELCAKLLALRGASRGEFVSKMAAIDVAVRMQLASDNKTLALTEDVSTAYGDLAAFKRFLLGVAHRLRLDTPARRFDWSDVATEENRSSNLTILCSLIEERTLELDGGT